jgi:hypothetical protein
LRGEIGSDFDEKDYFWEFDEKGMGVTFFCLDGIDELVVDL